MINIKTEKSLVDIKTRLDGRKAMLYEDKEVKIELVEEKKEKFLKAEIEPSELAKLSYVIAKIELMTDLNKIVKGFMDLTTTQEGKDILSELGSYLVTGILTGYTIQDEIWAEFVTKYNLDVNLKEDVIHVNTKEGIVWVAKGEKKKEAEKDVHEKLKDKKEVQQDGLE